MVTDPDGNVVLFDQHRWFYFSITLKLNLFCKM
jgi:hypothetical protein